MRIGGKLTLATAIVVIAVGFMLNAFFGNTLETFLVEQTRAGLLRQIRLAALHVTDQIDSKHPDRITDELGNLLEVRVTLIDSAGVVLGDSRFLQKDLHLLDNHGTRPEILQARERGFGRSVRHSDTLGKDMIYVAGTVPNVPGHILRLAIPMGDLRSSWAGLRGGLWVFIALGFITILTVSFALSRLLIRHIHRLTRLVQQMTDGDLSHRIDVRGTSTPEIRALASGLDDLRLQTRERMEDVIVENSRLEALLASLSEGIMVTEKNGRIRMTNRQFDRLFGLQGVETSGRMPIEVVRSNDVEQAVSETLRTSEGRMLEIVIGGVLDRHLDVHAAPILQDGECIGSVTVFYDISEIRRLEQVRKDFVANVSHELRTPLTSIKGGAATLADGALSDPEAAKRFVDSINTQADRLHLLLDDLLDLSHLESGGMQIEREVMDILDAVRASMDTVSSAAANKRIQLECDVPRRLEVVGDPALIRQAIVNLVDNAIKYTEEGGSLKVTVGLGGIPDPEGLPFASPDPSTNRLADDSSSPSVGCMHLEVTDTGIGIPSEDLPRIFERFYRVDRGRSRAMGGTGLGLAIVRHIIEAHGQRVYVRSAMGQGSTFGFTMELHNQPDEQ